MDLISRKEAKKIGLSYYFTGIPCKNGLIAKRTINSCNCTCDKCKCKKDGYHKKYYQLNKDKLVNNTREWRNKNRDKAREITKAWKLNNPHKNTFHEQKRNALKLNAIPIWFNELDEFVLSEAYLLTKIRERITNIKWHVDHMIPLQSKTASGLHCANNIQVIPQKLNSFKLNRMIFTNPFEWIKGI